MRVFKVLSYRIILFTILFIIISAFTSKAINSNVIANNDIVTIYQNRTFNIPILENDFGLESGIKSLTIKTSPLYGTCKVLPGNAIAYTPGYNFIGTDLFQYRVCSKSGECAEASVFINVLDYNFQPNLSNDTLILINGTKDLRLNILENDLDIYDEPITVTLLGQLSNGTAVLNDDNTLTPTFKQFFYGMDSLQYSICDIDNQCDTAWVFLDVKSKFDKNKIFVPTGISPNGDGLNDHFFIPELKKYPQCEITIFTQWGQVVYTDTDYNNNWDGRSNTGSYNGDLLPTGTYYYVIIVTGSDLKIAGFIYLSR